MDCCDSVAVGWLLWCRSLTGDLSLWGKLLAFNFFSPSRPPAAHWIFWATGGFSHYEELCQICAGRLLIWTLWPIWRDEGTVSCAQSTAVGVPIPSLATIVSISYKLLTLEFRSISVQFRRAVVAPDLNSTHLLISHSTGPKFLSIADSTNSRGPPRPAIHYLGRLKSLSSRD